MNADRNVMTKSPGVSLAALSSSPTLRDPASWRRFTKTP
jgi:hypothetical protein